MRWIKIFLIFLLLYGVNSHQQFYFSSLAEAKDNRQAILKSFLEKQNSPLAGSSADFLEISDKYSLDWRLLPAIAGVESTFERNGNTFDYNPFGYMCGSSPCQFNSYRQGIDRVARTIARGNAYTSFQQTKSIFELAEVYNAVSPQEWTQKINFFMGKLNL